MSTEDIKGKTLSGVKWSALESLSNQAISFVISIILARLLNPTDYGVIGMLSIFMAVSSTFIDSGFGQALIRKNDAKDIDYTTIFYFNLAVSVGCYVLLFLCSSLIARFFDMPLLSSIVKIYCLCLIINAFGTVPRTRLTKNLEFKSIAKINVISTIFSGLIGVTLAYVGWGVWALVWQSVLSAIFSNIVLWSVSKWRPLLEFSKESFKEMFGFGSKLLAGGLIWQLYSNLTPLIIGKFFSARDLGLYSRGSNIASLPASTIFGVISKVSYPIFSKLQDDTERLIRVYRKYIKFSSMLIIFALLLLAALARPVVLVLLTEKWESCIIFLQLFALTVMTDHIDKLNLNLLVVVGRSDLNLKLEIYKRAVSLTFLFAAIPFGVIGICVSRMIYAQIALMFNTYYTGRLFSMGYFKQLRDISPYIIFGTISSAPALILTYTSLPNWSICIIGVLIAVPSYFIFMRMLKDEAYMELIQIVKEMRQKN